VISAKIIPHQFRLSLFKSVKYSYDEEAYEVLLADDELREEFYGRLSEYSKTLAIAFSSDRFLFETDDKTLFRYKADLRKFQLLKASVKKVITEKMGEDPAFYEKFSKLIQQAIEDFRAKRISDLDYLEKVVDIRDKVVGKVHDDVPKKLTGNEDAMAYYGVLKPFFEKHDLDESDLESIAADTAIAIHSILKAHQKVQFWDDEDALKQTVNEIDDYLYDELKAGKSIELSLDQMDKIIEKVLQVAKHRSYRLSHIKLHKAKGRRLYCNTPTTDNAVKFNM